MQTEELRRGQAVVVSPIGRLDAAGAHGLEARLVAIAERGDRRLVLDCSRMTYISSSGLRALLVGAKTCRQAGGRLAVAALGPECRSVVEMSGLLSALDCHETVEAALAEPDRIAPAEGCVRPARREAPAMRIEERREREPPAAVLSLNGRLDGTGAVELETRVRRVVERGEVRVVLDFQRVGYINSAGLRALLICVRACRRKGGNLVLAALRPQCREIVVMSGFRSFIDCYETPGEALAALA